MALDSPAPIKRRDYFSRFSKRAAIVIIVGSCAISLFVTSVLALGHFFSFWSVGFFALIIILGTLLSSVNILIFWYLARPFRDLVNEVVVVSGSPTQSAPPNPNNKQYERDGFREILQGLYELAGKANTSIVDSPDGQSGLLSKALDQTATGVAILNPKHEIVYHNKKAPVHIRTDGTEWFDLLFSKHDSIDSWLIESDKRSVNAEHLWTRIPDRAPGEHGRRIYDVLATYRKDNQAETVVTFFDRTSTYAPEEDDLDFISFAAHELRGPITVIRGYLDVLDEELHDSLERDQVELLKRLTVSANRLSSYVNNILNASRYDRRHFKVYLKEEKLSDVYHIINEDMQLRAVSQNRLLLVDIPDTLPTVAADRNSIGEVLSNLIDNAIKYSNEGGQVVVKAEVIRGFVQVSITDRGIGIPSSVLPNLFHKFYRSHRSRETVAGTGIGLYISKAIVESHGGSIEVRSTEEEGSTFSFTLPIYETVAEKIKRSQGDNALLIDRSGGWIRNHSMYRS